jgi:CBS domain-containing protein
VAHIVPDQEETRAQRHDSAAIDPGDPEGGLVMTADAHPLGSRRAPRLERVRVADAMHPGVMTCVAETPLRDVARMMVTHRIHCVAVPGDSGMASWSIVSDLDLVGAAGAGGVDARTAGDIAATEALTISADQPLDRAVQLMSEHQAAHVVVVAAASGRPVGVLSTLDVAALLAGGEA